MSLPTERNCKHGRPYLHLSYEIERKFRKFARLCDFLSLGGHQAISEASNKPPGADTSQRDSTMWDRWLRKDANKFFQSVQTPAPNAWDALQACTLWAI